MKVLRRSVEITVIKPKELFSAVRWLRKRRAKRVYVGGGDGAAA
jgi:hypothetical protein